MTDWKTDWLNEWWIHLLVDAELRLYVCQFTSLLADVGVCGLNLWVIKRCEVAPLLIWCWKLNSERLFSPLSVSSVPLIPVTGSPSRTNPSNSADDHLEGKELVSLMIKFNQPFKNIWTRFSWAEQCNGLEMRQRMGKGRRRRGVERGEKMAGGEKVEDRRGQGWRF